MFGASSTLELNPVPAHMYPSMSDFSSPQSANALRRANA